MEEATKQEGEFSLKGKSTKPKQLNQEAPAVTKVSIKEPVLENKEEVTKVVIPNDTLKPEENAIQEQEAEKPVLRTEQSEMGLQEVGQGNEGSAEDVITKLTPLQEVTEEEIKQVAKEAQEAVRDEKILGRKLPENVEKLVNFMEDTGGTVEDYVRLNADYSTVDETQLLREYYKKTKPYLDAQDMDIILEDYEYDEDLDEERDIRKKKIAFKEEVNKARNFLEQTKSKYYDEIKLRPGVTQDQQKATDFFSRYNEEQKVNTVKQENFKDATSKLFNDDFKGFDFNVGEKKFRYGVKNPSAVAEQQSDITNFIGKFLNKEGEIADAKGYHKALYAARNADTIAQHFYEQGKADQIKEVVAKSKNITTEPRKTSTGSEFVNGWKVKAVNGNSSSSKLSIKKNKFN
tara:strand:- start:134 stop:1345 length:1212 start_codon:yes stop_codon:yes gene_type:complete